VIQAPANDNAPITPILSSVDNGWLATGLHLVANSVPELSTRAEVLFNSMDFGFYYRPAVNRIAFFYAPDTGESPCCYDTIVSESRIASYIGIATGKIPSREYFGAWRTFPDTCDWSWQETRPLGVTRLGRRLGDGLDEPRVRYGSRGRRVAPVLVGLQNGGGDTTPCRHVQTVSGRPLTNRRACARTGCCACPSAPARC
jgi:hypothetical protein